MKTKLSSIPSLAAVLIALTTLGCGEQINYLKARNELNKGVRAFSGANYAGAAEFFDAAIQLDPGLTDAKSYQAYSYMMQYIPGADSPENDAMAKKAIDGFEGVLAENPDNELAVSAMASLFFNMKKFNEAEEWHRRRIALLEKKASQSKDGKIDPIASESYYTIGVIKWTQSYEPRLKLRADLGMKPEDPGPIKDKAQREELATTLLPIIDDGIAALENALKINPDYTDAMVYINLLYRERSDFAATQEEFEQNLEQAEEWVEKTLATRKRLNDEATVDRFTAE